MFGVNSLKKRCILLATNCTTWFVQCGWTWFSDVRCRHAVSV